MAVSIQKLKKAESLYIVGLDPGGTTGWAAGTHYANDKDPDPRRYEIRGKDHHTQLYQELDWADPDVVVCEDFFYQRRIKVDLISVEYIGVARLWALTHERPFVLQPPSAAKRLITDDKLRNFGLWEPNQPHAMDATRHWMYFVIAQLGDKTWVHLLKPE